MQLVVGLIAIFCQVISGFEFDEARGIHLFGIEKGLIFLVRSEYEEVSDSNSPESLIFDFSKIRSKRSIENSSTNLSLFLKDERIIFQLKSKEVLGQRIHHEECIFQGRSVFPNDSFSIALTGCGEDTQGIILTQGDDYYVIRPKNHFTNFTNPPDFTEGPESHVIQKRSANWKEHSKCSYDPEDDPFPFDKIEQHLISEFAAVRRYSDLKIELGLFVDDAMWNFFNKFYKENAEKQIKRFVLTVVNNVLIFLRYDLYRGSEKTIAGFAPVKGMCVDLKSCTVNEGLDFGAVFVIAHEMGHSLGMYHDGESNQCHSRCCIMSPSIGTGKTQWSDCSTDELKFFISKLGTDNRAHNCLGDDTSELEIPRFKKLLPGQQYSMDEQCSLFHGPCWKQELKDGQKLKDICEMIWCTSGEGIVRTTHPALEGTYCGENSICIEGSCVPASDFDVELRVTDGQWSEWSDQGSCVKAECNECQIQGQLRVRGSVRRCSSPFKNNGGKECPGSSIRGFLCGNSACEGKSIENYASEVCTKFSQDPSLLDLGLSGKGIQFFQAPCKVWCHLGTSRNLRTVADFPDGTPCGESKYCIKGQCLSLTCGKPTLVDTVEDCPKDSVDVELKSTSFDRGRGDPLNQTLIDLSNWTEWELWSSCTAPRCGENGIKQRFRSCLVKNPDNSTSESEICAGARRQRTPCVLECP
ncbi:hypothetical protein FO519_007820 [Halicephalobus sp. NKZ332]|nr:hypothetical protein FO519_007820 [Halicephalobus sp. NKZ332]